MYTDSHAHLDGKRFDPDRAAVFARAKGAGVEYPARHRQWRWPGTGTLDCAVNLAEQYEWMYATVGIHPHEAELAKQEDFDELERLARSRR